MQSKEKKLGSNSTEMRDNFFEVQDSEFKRDLYLAQFGGRLQ